MIFLLKMNLVYHLQKSMVFNNWIKWKIHMHLNRWQHLVNKIYQIINMDKAMEIKTKKLLFWNKLFLRFSKIVKLLRPICKDCRFKLEGLKGVIHPDRNSRFNSKIFRIMRVCLLIILKMELLFQESKQSSCFQKIEIMTLNIIDSFPKLETKNMI